MDKSELILELIKTIEEELGIYLIVEKPISYSDYGDDYSSDADLEVNEELYDYLPLDITHILEELDDHIDVEDLDCAIIRAEDLGLTNKLGYVIINCDIVPEGEGYSLKSIYLSE